MPALIYGPAPIYARPIVVVPGNTGLGPLAECEGLGECLAEVSTLSEEDSARLTDALQRELGAQS